MTSFRSAYAISGSTIQNSVRCRRVFDFSARNVGPKQYTLPSAMALASLYSWPLCVRKAVVSSKYCTGNSVVVPSHAAGVKIGVSHEDESAVVEEVADSVDDLVANAQDRGLPLGPDPEVPAIHQVVDAVFLWRDRVVVRLADAPRCSATSISKPPRARASARTVPVTESDVSWARWSARCERLLARPPPST